MLLLLFQQNLHTGVVHPHSSTSAGGQGGPTAGQPGRIAIVSDSQDPTVFRKRYHTKRPWRHKRAVDLYETEKYGRKK